MVCVKYIVILLLIYQVKVCTEAWSIWGDETLDPVTGLTGAEKMLIKKTWGYLMQDPVKYGADIFLKLFSKYPEYLKYFSFGNVELDELKDDEDFIVYINLVMYAIESVIDNLESNPEIMKAILRKLGSNHVMKNVIATSFWNLRDILLEMLRPLVNRITYLAWEKFLELSVKHMTANMTNGMGAIYSLLGWADAGVPDPVTGLTPRENKLIQDSWAEVMKNPVANGMAVMLRLFEKHPEYKELFPFRDVPNDELKDVTKFKVHCNLIMYQLKQIVDNLGDTDIVIGMLDNIAASHIKHKAPAKGFHDIEAVILEVLKSKVSTEAYIAWKKLLHVAMTHIASLIH